MGVTGFRDRVVAGEPVLGAFIKSASQHVAEVMGHSALDFLIADAEHAPLGIGEIDRIVMGARSGGVPCLVRPADHAPSFINQCLDAGAGGIMAPHVANPAQAAALVAAVKYCAGERGHSPSTRAGGFGQRKSANLRADLDAASSLWAQIEDREALGELDAIAGTDGIDCLFVGRVDLAGSLGVDRADHPDMLAAIQAVAAAARRNRVALGFYVGKIAEIGPLRELGASVFACGSDQNYLLAQASANRAAFDETVKHNGT